MLTKKPTATLEDFGGDKRLYDMASPIFDEAWGKANPAGTLVGSYTMPQLDSGAFKAAGGDIGDWAAASRVYQRIGDQAAQTGKASDIPSAVAEGIANGTIDNMGAANNYGALAAGKLADAENMGSFSYDFNKDPIFKILSASYMQQARDAASNASAMAAARTGGYGNSYGATAAAQQYNRALGDLHDQVPELQQAAYARWQNDRNALLDQADRYQGLADSYYSRGKYEDETAYNRDQDAKNREWTEAVTLAQMGEYDKMEELLGVDMSSARGMDNLNKIMSVIQLYGDAAPSILQNLMQAQPDMDMTTQTFTVGGGTYHLPESGTAEDGTKTVYSLIDGKPYVTITYPDGNKKERPYTGIAVSHDGKTQINLATGEVSPYSGPTKAGGFTTGDATVDGLLRQIAATYGPTVSTTPGTTWNPGGLSGLFDYSHGSVYEDPVRDAAASYVDSHSGSKGSGSGGGKSYSGSGSGTGTGSGNGGETTTVVPQATVPGGDAPKEITVSTEEFDDILKRSTR